MQIHQQAWETFTHLTRAMTKAALVILEYGQRYPHTTHLVLMQGSLTLLQEPQSGRRRASKRSGGHCYAHFLKQRAEQILKLHFQEQPQQYGCNSCDTTHAECPDIGWQSCSQSTNCHSAA